VEYDLGIPEHDNEGRVITAEFKELIVVAVYVPNSGDSLLRLPYRVNEFDRDFHNHLEKLKNETSKPVVISGDLNVAHHEIDVYDPKKMKGVACFTEEERNSFGSLLDRGFVDTFRYFNPGLEKFSFWSARGHDLRGRNMGWRLDYALIDSVHIDCVVDSTIHKEFLGSDHCPV
jgi:exodeoxyribonuclease-3